MNAERTRQALQRFHDGEVVTYSVRPDVEGAPWTNHAGVLKAENGCFRLCFDEEEAEEMYDVYDLDRPSYDHVDIPVDGFTYKNVKSADAYKTAALQKQVSELSKAVATTMARESVRRPEPPAKVEETQAKAGEKRKHDGEDIPESAADEANDAWWMPLPRDRAWPTTVEFWFERLAQDVGGLIRDLQSIYFDSEPARRSEAMKEGFNALCHLLQGMAETESVRKSKGCIKAANIMVSEIRLLHAFATKGLTRAQINAQIATDKTAETTDRMGHAIAKAQGSVRTAGKKSGGGKKGGKGKKGDGFRGFSKH